MLLKLMPNSEHCSALFQVAPETAALSPDFKVFTGTFTWACRARGWLFGCLAVAAVMAISAVWLFGYFGCLALFARLVWFGLVCTFGLVWVPPLHTVIPYRAGPDSYQIYAAPLLYVIITVFV